MDWLQNYIKKVDSALSGGGLIAISAFAEDHTRARPVLHPLANRKTPDISALVYSLLRLPVKVFIAKQIILAQSDGVFRRSGFNMQASGWQKVTAIARRRSSFFNASKKTLGIFIASSSDVLDVVALLTALYIEITKLHALTRSGKELRHCFSQADFSKLKEILGGDYLMFEALVNNPVDWGLRLLAGSWVDYSKAVQEWWVNIARVRKESQFNVYKQPIYFVSSNSHSLMNILSGWPYRQKQLVTKVAQEKFNKNKTAFTAAGVAPQNISYYLSRFVEKRDPRYTRQKNAWEARHGLRRLAPFHHIDIEAQLFSIKDFVKNPALDARLGISPRLCKKLAASNALILNIAYPLGLSAYHILDEVSENVAEVRGVYVMGKAASLNAGVGDISIPTMVYDQASRNTIFLENVFSPDSFAAFAPKQSIFAAQKAVSVPGTFFQNDVSLKKDLQNGYSIIEMEAGPYLTRVFEMTNPVRHPIDTSFVLTPHFRLGLAYYISDTPYNKGANLGSKRLTWEGLNATYAISLGIIKDILETELKK